MIFPSRFVRLCEFCNILKSSVNNKPNCRRLFSKQPFLGLLLHYYSIKPKGTSHKKRNWLSINKKPYKFRKIIFDEVGVRKTQKARIFYFTSWMLTHCPLISREKWMNSKLLQTHWIWNKAVITWSINVISSSSRINIRIIIEDATQNRFAYQRLFETFSKIFIQED